MYSLRNTYTSFGKVTTTLSIEANMDTRARIKMIAMFSWEWTRCSSKYSINFDSSIVQKKYLLKGQVETVPTTSVNNRLRNQLIKIEAIKRTTLVSMFRELLITWRMNNNQVHSKIELFDKQGES